MLVFCCRKKSFKIDESMAESFPYLNNVLNNRDQFKTSYYGNTINLNIDPIIMTQLINFYVMPQYKIPNKYLINTKNLASFMGKSIFKTIESDNKIINNIYLVNYCSYIKSIYVSPDRTPNIVNTVQESFYFKHNNTTIKLLFHGHPVTDVPEDKKPDYNRYAINMMFNLDTQSIALLNNLLFNDNINNKHQWTFNCEILTVTAT